MHHEPVKNVRLLSYCQLASARVELDVEYLDFIFCRLRPSAQFFRVALNPLGKESAANPELNFVYTYLPIEVLPDHEVPLSSAIYQAQNFGVETEGYKFNG